MMMFKKSYSFLNVENERDVQVTWVQPCGVVKLVRLGQRFWGGESTYLIKGPVILPMCLAWLRVVPPS